jgi:hypothetical protein
MRSTFLRSVILAALAAGGSSSWAQGASTLIGGFKSLATEDHVKAQMELCSQRFPATAEAWKSGFQSFRDSNAQALAELADIARRIDGQDARVVREFKSAALMMVAAPLAAAPDDQALPQCEQWRNGLAAANKAMPAILDAARKLDALKPSKP